MKAKAIRRLTNRWKEQVEKFPNMRHEIPLEQYIQTNWRTVARRDLLKNYEGDC